MLWTLDQAKEHPLWRGLTDKERLFFELLEKHELDDVAAAEGAFDLQPQSVQVRLNQLRSNQDTGFLYRAMMGFALPTRDELAAALWQLGNKTKDEARKLSAYKAAGEILEYHKPSRKGSSPAPTAEGGEPAEKETAQEGPDLSDFQE
ncbi:MAG TPA: hypothetical protein VHA06_08090 [Candidatus Angelobacter sp.]|jgi:hypothetical protein|nr:hypothetical protein [Candidatus Angelobacter sp.]